jgi:L-fuconolactonase
MIRIDAHQHFWNYDPDIHGWMTNEMALIKTDFQPGDLYPHLIAHGIDGTVLVQVDQSDQETDYLLNIAEKHEFVKGVVGWVDLSSEHIDLKLREYSKKYKLKGFRHILQSDEPSFMLRPDFLRGIAALKEFDFTYDILIYPQHLDAALDLVQRFPSHRLVIDHLAKPDIKHNQKASWERGIRKIAAYQNVYCKISGMVTEADWNTWEQDEFKPYMDVVVDCFGVQRVMYGSDWPMCRVTATYDQVMNIAQDYFSSFSREDQDLFFGGNAIKFYKL